MSVRRPSFHTCLRNFGRMKASQAPSVLWPGDLSSEFRVRKLGLKVRALDHVTKIHIMLRVGEKKHFA